MSGVNGQKSASLMIALWVGIIVLFVGGIVAIAKYSNQTSVATPTVHEITAIDHFKGGENAPVTLIEYGDFECPPCGRFYPVVKQMHEIYGDQVKIVYRYFPIVQIHRNALPAAYAAEAASRQGKFWEMHDMLFEGQEQWADNANAKDTFASYAETIGLNMDQYRKDVDSKEVQDIVTAQYQGGMNAGVQGTPTFFLQGEKIEVPGTVDAFKSVIDAALAQANAQ